ncbi:MAG: hypothetical protein IJO13_08035, partial [Lachnospiraceae bacterium]|nr:hypothetical protein [Lachnospiraceae bacterium]
GLNTDWLDILIVPDLYPLSEVEFGFLRYFQDKGGALILSASDLLMRGKTVSDSILLRPDEDLGDYGFFSKSVAKIGIRPSIADADPTCVQYDTDFVPGVDAGVVDMQVLPDGAKFHTTSTKDKFFPVWGTEFPERYEVTRNYEIAAGYDKFGRHINVPVCFSQNWENGSRQCLFASNREGSFFDPAHPDFYKLLDAAVAFCKNGVMAQYLQPKYACYRQGEAVGIDFSLKNASAQRQVADVKIVISGGSDRIERNRQVVIPAGEIVKGEVFWMPDSFTTDLYDVTMYVSVGGVLVSRAENAFVVWNEEVIANGPKFDVDGSYFTFNGEKFFLSAANYYDSNQNAGMWAMPNVRRLNADIKQMAEYGMRYIRIHYHHPKWFYDYYLDAHGFVPPVYESLGESYLPSEKHWLTFDAHVYLCQKYGVVYGGDVLTLRPKEMGDPRGWIDLFDYAQYADAIECQKEFLKMLVPRYKDVPGISWDIYNEPIETFGGNHSPEYDDRIGKWGKELTEYMRSLGEPHTICVGYAEDTPLYREFASYAAPHNMYYVVDQLEAS